MRRRILTMTTALVAAGSAALGQDVIDLDTIYVDSVFRAPRALQDTPVTVSVVEADALETKQAGDFYELIGNVPGLTIGGGPRGISQTPNIRGFDDDQIVLRFDGGRFNFTQGHRGRFFIDPELVQSVEVIRGGGSTLYGSGALGGVISVETRDVADLLEPGETTGARVSLGYSSNGEILKSSAAVFGDWGAWDALLFLGTQQIGDNLDAGGGTTVPFSDIDQNNLMAKIGFEASPDSRIELSYSAFEDSGLTPANSSDTDSSSNPVVDRDSDVSSLRLRWDYAPSDSDWLDLSVLFYGETLKITEDRISAPRLDETTYDTIGLDVTNRTSLDLGRPVELVYGFEVFEDSQKGLRDGATRPAFPEAEALTIGFYAEATTELSQQLDLTTGLRYDIYQRDPNDIALADVDESFLSPRIGLNYRPNDNWQVYGNIARAFRAPSLTELYNDGLHFPGSVPFPPDNFFVPNPNLEPEESTQLELGTRFEGNGIWQAEDTLMFSVNTYYADVQNYIEQNVDIFAGTTTTNNVDAQLWGFEAELDYDAQTWFAGAGLSIARGHGDDGDWLGSIPQDRLTLNAGLRPWDGWELGAQATFAAAQDRVPAGDAIGSSYKLLDLYATYAPDTGPMAGGVIRFGIDNLFDENYTIYPNGLAQTGRAVEISATWSF